MKKINKIPHILYHLKKNAAIPLLLSLGVHLPLHANPAHEQLIESVKEAVIHSLEETGDPLVHSQVVVNALDPRIQVPVCEPGFRFDVAKQQYQQSYLNVKVSCPSLDWSLYVNAKLSHTMTVAVFNSVLSPNTLITQEHLSLTEINVQQLRSTPYHNIEELIGTRVKQRTRAGQPVQPHLLCFVCKGDRITIIAKSEGMQISASGVALQDGGIGDSIKVMNSNSRKQLYAQVDNLQQVVINL